MSPDRALARNLCLLLALLAPPARAEWRPDGNRITTHAGGVALPRLAPDRRGGVFAAWMDDERVPLVTRLTADGGFAPGWPSEGRFANEGLGADIRNPEVVADGLGGCYLVWIDGSGNVRAQHLDGTSSVARAWPAEGLVVSGRLVRVPSLHVASDGKHGLLIAANDWVQRVGPDATLAWTDGVVVGTPVRFRSGPTLVPDRDGGAYVFWAQGDTSIFSLPELLGQHLDANGSPTWEPEGTVVGHGYFNASPPVAIPIGRQDAVIAWDGIGDTGTELLATRVTPGGESPWGRGRTVATDTYATDLQLVELPEEGVLLAWHGLHLFPPPSLGFDIAIRVQRLDRSGQVRWPAGGITVHGEPAPQTSLSMAADGEGGAFLAWGESHPQSELYAIRIGADGLRAPTWPEGGAPLCRPPTSIFGSRLQSLSLVSTAPGQAIVAWDDYRADPTGNFDVPTSLVMRLDRDGPAAYAEGQAPLLGALYRRGPGNPRVPIVFAVAPDPSARSGRVRCTLPEDGDATLEVFDVAGRRVAEQAWVATRGSTERSLATAGAIPAGLYLVRLRQRTQVATTRAIVLP